MEKSKTQLTRKLKDFIAGFSGVHFDAPKTKKHIAIALAAAVLLALSAALFGANAFYSIGIAALVFVSIAFRVRFDEEVKGRLHFFILLVWSFLIYVAMQLIIGPGFFLVGFRKFLLNLLFIGGILAILCYLIRNFRYCILGFLLFSSLFAFVNNMVVQTRNMEIQFSDIWSFGTAINVVASYKYHFSQVAVFGLYLLGALIIFDLRCVYPKIGTGRKRFISGAAGPVAVLLTVCIVSSNVGASAIRFREKYWSYRGSEYNGFYVNLIRSASASKVKKPANYSPDAIRDMWSHFPIDPKPTDPPVVETKKPNVIVVMNETFADMQAIASYFGTEMPTDSEILPFYRSLTNDMPNVSKGYALSSVYGGNTANSEFEFLTGSSMLFLPRSSVPYNLYLKENNSCSIVQMMKANGYYTVAMHPEVSSNWSREKIYSYYGFDEALFIDSFSDYETYRSEQSSGGLTLMTDSSAYEKLIDVYKKKASDQPIFTFLVTIQNHGGYNTTGFTPNVSVETDDPIPSLNEYLSCIQKSDEALRELIDYFSNQKEDTMIVFFGDHQPSLPNSVYYRYFGVTDASETEDLQCEYAVPYMYWANFDFKDEERELTSLNFLGPRLMNILGLQQTDYFRFVSTVSEKISAMNAFGWWNVDEETGKYVYHAFDPKDSTNTLLLYEMMQYNLLFDADKLTKLFTISDETDTLETESGEADPLLTPIKEDPDE